ncbi:vitellogenin-like [Atheta coriaria]|uniref:vitellogenin-like n=1 Tax=Dalotia coriaria TaxID=877792 RepID=UPI0031F3CD48
MWSQILLCCLVGFAAASDYGWKSNTEYVYKVHGRTLTGLHEVENQYSGMMMKAALVVRPQDDGKLMAQIQDAKYAQVHAHLPEGWRSDIPEGKLSYQQLPISEHAFEIVIRKGVVRDVIVAKEVANWEANFIKAIVSNLQLDTQGERVIKSHVNQLPEADSNNAVFKTMEDSIGGRVETLYDISPLPEYVLQSQPWLAPKPEMKGDGEYIEIVKNRNFSRAGNVGYHFGLGNNVDWEPYSNQMGDFFLRSSMSRVVISGKLQHYTIQSAATTNKIILSPTLNSQQNGMVVSHLNMTLHQVQPAQGQFQQPQQGHNLGSLVYSYNKPYSDNHEPKQWMQNRDDEDVSDSSSEENQYAQRYNRHRRSSGNQYTSGESHEYWTQDQPQLHEAPETPLLPFYIGNQGKSIKQSQKVQVEQVAQKLAQQIGEEIQRPEHIHKEKTLAKFTILARIVRIMNENEMQQVVKSLYCTEEKGAKLDSWRAYRDALAEAGTGPALLTIKDLAKNKKIRGEEAAELIATAAQSARHPTPEYMRTFYALATCDEVKHQAILNDSAILSFTTLARKVYSDKVYSDNQYPTQAFGSFRKNEQGQKFVAEEVIPYLKQQLNEAVQQADSHKIHVYIRALGNVAQKKILGVFEPYLEGKKQCSQFQRLQMVVALDKLAMVHPKVARSVLYKIYQNAGEQAEIRVAAVYQLIRTGPPASMLQRMAQYTHVDEDEQVNAAVKSAIESAAELEGEQFAELAENARSALPLLTKNTYGINYSQNYLRSYVIDEMNMLYKQDIYSIGSHDSLFPKGLKYYLRSELGGYKTEIVNLKAMVSSIDELTNVLQQQTEIHQQKQKQQKQNAQQAQQNQFSSESILRLLNVQNEEREQLEANLLLQLGGGASRFFTINNRTVEMLPEALAHIEDLLRQGQNIHYTKFLNRFDLTISYPTAMSFPFVYTLDAPTMLHVQGKVQATAEPKISSGDKIHKPQTLKAQSEIRAVVSTKVQAKLGFVTPYDHQHYIAGVEKNVQVHIPVKSQIEIDLKNKQVHAEIEPLQHDKNTQVFHYSMYPYTAKHDILRTQPLQDSEVQVIYQQEQPQTRFETVVGKKAGMAFRVEYVSEQKHMDGKWLYDQLQRHDAISALLAPAVDETIQHTKLNIEYDAEKSQARKAIIRMGYERRYENDDSSNDSTNEEPKLEQFSQLPKESKARQQKFAKMAAAGIRSASVGVYDASIEFDGQNKIEYAATLAVASGPADHKARALFYVKRNSGNHGECKPFEFAAAAKTRAPNTNALDFGYALKFDPTTAAHVEIAYGQDLQSAAKVQVHAKLEKSESRRRYLQAHPRAQECRHEMQSGNYQLPACANMTAEANLLDRVHVQVQYDNITPVIRNATYKIYSALRHMGYYNLDENVVSAQGTGKDNQIELEARFEPDFESVNVTLRAPKVEAQFNEIRVNDWARQVVAVHPAYPLNYRAMSHALDIDTYGSICVVDKNAANTLDNKTYPLRLGSGWTVMMQYVPTFARQHHQEQKYIQQQEEQQQEQYVVLVRDSQSGEHKELKMTIRTPESQGQLIEVDVKPQQGQQGEQPRAQITVNQKAYQLDDKKSTDIEGGLIQMYVLPRGEVAIEVRDAFYVIYDGERVMLSATHDKFRDAVRGLCGTFTGEQVNDFLTPKNCIVRDAKQFAASWAIEGESRQHAGQHKGECVYEDVEYVNVVSDYDAGRTQHKQGKHHQQQRQQEQYERSGSNSGCSKHQTRYVEENGEICFTIRPHPVCKSSCRANGEEEKKVPAHCVKANSVTDLWKKQIQRGANPDFSHKSVTRDVRVPMPKSCTRQ